MTRKAREFAGDKTAPERRRNLSEEEIRELELAGGVEGGMRAGSAGGPGSTDEQSARKTKSDQG